MFRTVVVRTPGSFVGKRGERMVVRLPKPKKAPGEAVTAATRAPNDYAKPLSDPKEGEEEIPLFRVGEILLAPHGVTVSTDLIEEAVRRGIPISFVSAGGQPFAMLTSPMLTATVATRRAQLRAMDSAAGADLARAFVAGKLRNQASLLVYFAKAEKADPERRARVLGRAVEVRAARKRALAVRGTTPDAIREEIMGVEGYGARSYWDGIKALLEGRISFEGRTGRGAVDPVNALLNYGYGILTSRVWAALLLAGLDPFAGMLHADRSGKPSLVLDLMEELRAPAVDRAVLAHVRLGQPVRFEGSWLDEATRRAIADAVFERLRSPVVIAGRKLELASVLQRQARAVATHVRGEGAYQPFAMTW
jgi:CRISPR-associated protein Cas1